MEDSEGKDHKGMDAEGMDAKGDPKGGETSQMVEDDTESAGGMYSSQTARERNWATTRLRGEYNCTQ